MLQDEQFPIDREIGSAVLLDIDPEWAEFFLEVEEAGNSQRIVVENIQNGETAMPSDDLMVATRKLFLLFKQYQCPLRSMKYVYKKQKDGKWNFVSNYVYED